MRWGHHHEEMLSFAATALIANVAATLAGNANANRLKRLYVLDCGRLIAKDQSRWTPSVNADQHASSQTIGTGTFTNHVTKA